MIRDVIKEVPSDVTLLDMWYKQDENAVPPVHILQPISSILTNFNNKVSKKPWTLGDLIYSKRKQHVYLSHVFWMYFRLHDKHNVSLHFNHFSVTLESGKAKLGSNQRNAFVVLDTQWIYYTNSSKAGMEYFTVKQDHMYRHNVATQFWRVTSKYRTFFLHQRHPRLMEQDQNTWWETMGKLQKMLRKGAQVLFLARKMDRDQLHNYFMSGKS